MALNLVRNSKVFFTTNVDNAGNLQNGGYGLLNTYELRILDNFSFSQNTNTETITINESGATPVRGQRSFNTSLAPVDFSFSTYICQKVSGGKIVSDESNLWNALLTSNGIYDSTRVTLGGGGAAGSITGVTFSTAAGTLTIAGTTLPTGSFTVNDKVVVSGLTSTVGHPSAYVNGYGTVSAITAGTQIVVTLDSGASTTATTITTPTTMVLTKVGISQETKFGTGGTGSITGVTYAFANGIGTLSVTGTSLPTVATDIRVLTGIGTSSITGSTAEVINQAVLVTTSTGTSLVAQILNPPTSAVTFSGVTAFSLTKSAWAENGTSFSVFSTAASDTQQLQKFGLLFLVDNVFYGIDNCALNQASIDFAIDGIATITWTGQGTSLRRMSSSATATGGAATGNFSGTMVYGKYTTYNTDPRYITNKLSTIDLTAVNDIKNKANTTVMAAGSVTPLAITGGNITINNNITYLTPANLGTVNVPITYFQGTRAITGTINAYLKTGAGNDIGELLADLLDGAGASAEIMMKMVVNLGGTSTPKVVLEMPSTTVTIPTVDVQQVVSTSINFTAEGSTPGAASTNTFDLEKKNDLTARYYTT